MKMPIAVGLLTLTAVQGAPTPHGVVEELITADRKFAAAAADTTVVPALASMFADDVVMPIMVPAPGFARGKAAAINALEANPDNARSTLRWRPLRGGVSADAQHGFTVGYMTMTGEGGKAVDIKYVAYWVNTPAGWRVAAYRRVPADAAPATQEMLPPATPPRLVPPSTDPATLARHKASLESAERSFSDEAQKLGLGPAFAKFGSADAVNVGPRSSPTFIVGAAEIAKSVGAGSEGQPSPVSWAADEGSLVASSGDLGVTFGYIRQHAAPKDGRPAAVPFFTIWRRADPAAPWRYVAE